MTESRLGCTQHGILPPEIQKQPFLRIPPAAQENVDEITRQCAQEVERMGAQTGLFAMDFSFYQTANSLNVP